MRPVSLRFILMTTLPVALALACSEDPTEPGPVGDSLAVYAGSASCNPCHAQINAIWSESGHPYSMMKVTGEVPVAQFPDLAAFAADPVAPPVPFVWDDISYVAGGYGWKMLWINEYGFVITSSFAGDPVQYNFADESWSVYGASYEFLNKPADCGRCHATGWVPDADWLHDNDNSDNQDGLPGIPGSFFAAGIQCEECHGAGSLHVHRPGAFDLRVNRTSADCGRCHNRDSQHRVLAFDDFLQPNSQYDEWLHSGHAILAVVECVDCHDPHASVKFDAHAAGAGTLARCEECHVAAAAVNRHDVYATMACVDCHMPLAVKNASEEHAYVADMRTHLMDIAVTPVDRVQGMGLTGGSRVITQDALNGMSRITLDFACYGCHQDPAGAGGAAVPLSLAELAAFASGIHQSATQ